MNQSWSRVMSVMEAKETGPKRAKCFENNAEPKDSPVRYKSTDDFRTMYNKLRSHTQKTRVMKMYDIYMLFL